MTMPTPIQNRLREGDRVTITLEGMIASVSTEPGEPPLIWLWNTTHGKLVVIPSWAVEKIFVGRREDES